MLRTLLKGGDYGALSPFLTLLALVDVRLSRASRDLFGTHLQMLLVAIENVFSGSTDLPKQMKTSPRTGQSALLPERRVLNICSPGPGVPEAWVARTSPRFGNPASEKVLLLGNSTNEERINLLPSYRLASALRRRY